MKTCTKCKIEYEATRDNFSPDKKAKDGLQSRCKVCQRERNRKNHTQEYRDSISGALQQKLNSIKHRCLRVKSYTDRGIKNKFKSLEHFRSYVVEVMEVDPRGLQVHRINNDGHYEEGNIEFVTRVEHDRLHAEMG